ncbi:MAG: type I methionyl aminopeptidase [Planctomycetota bacterium]|nr:type I methionyl aminopeptidase [Planctomycetota bacterium]MDA1179949.1 type I methionyl aminopeptidase [Planctomycetota bacterium]
MPDRPSAINLRSAREIERMRPAGQVVAEAHRAVSQLVRPGVTTRELDAAVEQVFVKHGAEPLFKGVAGPVPFPTVTCISVNDEVVHGIPSGRVLRDGDIVSVDTGCRVNGWCGDSAMTFAVGAIPPVAQKLLDVTREALEIAIRGLSVHGTWSEIGREMEEHVLKAGFSVVRAFCGHGIGRQLHEPPQVPNLYRKESHFDFPIKPGLVLAIEPMVCVGAGDVRCLDDHWTQVTRDGSLAAHFEHTVAVTGQGPEVLTL